MKAHNWHTVANRFVQLTVETSKLRKSAPIGTTKDSSGLWKCVLH